MGSIEVSRTRILRARYGFESWHVGASFHLRPYKEVVIRTIEQSKPGAVVEVGCGLGDVISRVTCETRIGLDQSEEVITAANRLHPNTTFRRASLEDAGPMLSELVSSIDVLVMVNWPHLLPIEEIRASVEQLQQEVPVSYLVIDAVHSEAVGYRNGGRGLSTPVDSAPRKGPYRTPTRIRSVGHTDPDPRPVLPRR